MQRPHSTPSSWALVTASEDTAEIATAGSCTCDMAMVITRHARHEPIHDKPLAPLANRSGGHAKRAGRALDVPPGVGAAERRCSSHCFKASTRAKMACTHSWPSALWEPLASTASISPSTSARALLPWLTASCARRVAQPSVMMLYEGVALLAAWCQHTNQPLCASSA